MEKEITQEPLAKMITNMWAFRALVSGVKLNVFEFLKESSTTSEIAQKLKVNTNSIERLLNAFVAMGLVKKKNNTYINLPISNKYLIKDLPTYYGDFILMIEESDNNWRQLDEAIITNKPILKDHDERLARPFFTRAMHNNAQAPANKLSEILDF